MSEKILVSNLNLHSPVDALNDAESNGLIYLQGMYYDICDKYLLANLFLFADYGVGALLADSINYKLQKKVTTCENDA